MKSMGALALAAAMLVAGCSASHHAAAPIKSASSTVPTTQAPQALPQGSLQIETIRIDAISLRARVRDGLDRTTLSLGPAHDPASGLPGAKTAVVIVGHRTTYTHPFFALDRLTPGSVVTLSNRAAQEFSYTVAQSTVVAPAQLVGLEQRSKGDLLLVANTPLYSAQSRLVVIARPEQPA